jgi:endonuclease/exonuclease/phosphatase (EEP) superfamily protein YafD
LNALRRTTNFAFAYIVFFVGVVSILACFDAYLLEAYIAVWFRFQLCLVLLVCTALLALLRSWKLLAASVVMNLPNIIAVAPYFIPAPQVVAATPGLRVCQINVNFKNRHYDWVARYLKQHDPDVIFIEELTDEWLRELQTALPEYSHTVRVARPDPFGIGIFSRLPLSEGRIDYYGKLDYPSATAVLDWNGRKIHLANVHPFPVFSQEQFDAHRLQLAGITEAGKLHPAIVGGDFNSPIWSFSLRELQSAAGLRSAANGFGWQPTWPRELAQWGQPDFVISNPLVMITIDHNLVSREFKVRKYESGVNVGSDHSPLFIELAME